MLPTEKSLVVSFGHFSNFSATKVNRKNINNQNFVDAEVSF